MSNINKNKKNEKSLKSKIFRSFQLKNRKKEEKNKIVKLSKSQELFDTKKSNLHKVKGIGNLSNLNSPNQLYNQNEKIDNKSNGMKLRSLSTLSGVAKHDSCGFSDLEADFKKKCSITSNIRKLFSRKSIRKSKKNSSGSLIEIGDSETLSANFNRYNLRNRKKSSILAYYFQENANNSMKHSKSMDNKIETSVRRPSRRICDFDFLKNRQEKKNLNNVENNCSENRNSNENETNHKYSLVNFPNLTKKDGNAKLLEKFTDDGCPPGCGCKKLKLKSDQNDNELQNFTIEIKRPVLDNVGEEKKCDLNRNTRTKMKNTIKDSIEFINKKKNDKIKYKSSKKESNKKNSSNSEIHKKFLKIFNIPTTILCPINLRRNNKGINSGKKSNIERVISIAEKSELNDRNVISKSPLIVSHQN